MPGFLQVFGYPDPSLPAGYGIDTVFQQLITSLLQVGLIFASFAVGPFSIFYGRRVCYWVGTVFQITGFLIQIFVTDKGPVYVARLLAGFGNGIYVTATILYCSEVAPAHLRGIMVAMFQFTQNIGGLIGAIINNYTSTIDGRHCYQIPIAILFVVPVFLTVLMFFIPESPRWLTDHGKHDEAGRALRRLRGNEFPEELIQEELLEIREATRIEKELAAHSSFRDLFRGSDLRRTLLACGASLCHSASGINFLVGYATYFLQISGITQPFKYSIVLQTVAVVMAAVGLVLNKFYGRRTLFISGASITCATLFIVAIIWTAGGSVHTAAQGRAIVAMVNIYLGAYSYSIGPMAWVSAGEIPSNRLRSLTLGLAMSITFLFAWLTTFTLPYFFNPQHLGWGPKIGWIWGPVNLIMLIWLIFFLPETKSRTLEECTFLTSEKPLTYSGRNVRPETPCLEIQGLQVCGYRECKGNSGTYGGERFGIWRKGNYPTPRGRTSHWRAATLSSYNKIIRMYLAGCLF
jgi:sugar porter (SP) family MFS transporter